MMTDRVTESRIHGLRYYKLRKFGKGRTAWIAFEAWMQEALGKRCDITELTDAEARELIARMKKLPDVPIEGQERLDI